MYDTQGGMPNFVKVILGVILVLLSIPMLLLSAVPNLFFGFSGSGTEKVSSMTELAMSVGGAYMTLEDFENTQIDAVVTRIAGEYEENGIAIDHIEVVNSFEEDDLLWFIAINSVAHRQDLEGMTTEDIHALCASRLTYQPTLLSGKIVTLQIAISKIDPETWMEQLGFDEEAKVWAGALYETLSESGDLEKYASYYAAYRPSYGGDTAYNGGVQYGDSYGNTIDVSRFVEPHTKNNLDLADYAAQAWENNWGYVWGTFGQVLTQSLLDYKAEQYPEGVGEYKDYITEHYLNRRTADCVGLIKGYGWLNPDTGAIQYGTHGMPDYNADQMYQRARDDGAEWGDIADMPDIPGLILWKKGHTGVYIGGGYAIEAMSTKKGVGKTEVEGRGWEAWYKLPFITYFDESRR